METRSYIARKKKGNQIKKRRSVNWANRNLKPKIRTKKSHSKIQTYKDGNNGEDYTVVNRGNTLGKGIKIA